MVQWPELLGALRILAYLESAPTACLALAGRALRSTTIKARESPVFVESAVPHGGWKGS